MSIGKHVQRALTESDGELPKVAKGRKALCHPTKANYLDGQCKDCVNRAAITRAVEAKMPHADDKLKKQYANELTELHRSVEYIEGLGRQARGILEDNLPAYAAMHFEGAKIAAADGDTRPAEWALSQVKAGKETPVQPPAKTAGESGIKIFIGVQMAGNGEPVEAGTKVIDVTPE